MQTDNFGITKAFRFLNKVQKKKFLSLNIVFSTSCVKRTPAGAMFGNIAFVCCLFQMAFYSGST